MNIKELITDLRARINPQYYDQIGTESYERHQVVKALEYLQQENERQRFDILAMNQSLDLLREENERLRKDADRIDWLSHQDFDALCLSLVIDAPHCGEYYVCGDNNDDGYGSTFREAIDAARGVK